MTNVLKFVTCFFLLSLTAVLAYGVREWENWKSGKIQQMMETREKLQQIVKDGSAVTQQFTETMRRLNAKNTEPTPNTPPAQRAP